MKKLIRFSFEYWKWILGGSVAFSLITLYFFLGIKIDNSIETLTIDNDPQLLLLRQMEKSYGGNEFVVISFQGKDIFSKKVISMIREITGEIGNIKNVERVLSLTNAYIIEEGEGGFGDRLLIPEKLPDSYDIKKLKNKIISNPLYRKWLYSDDGNATAIIAWIRPMGKDDAARWQVVGEIKKIVDRNKDDRTFYFYGMPVYQKLIFDAMLNDQLILTAILSIFVGMLLFYIFRDFRLVFLPFVLISVTGLWALGLLVMFGSTLNFSTSIIPVVVLIVCLCDSVHLISQLRETDTGEADRKNILMDVTTRIGIPIMLTSLTTAFGFFSLGISSIKPVRDFGIFTGIGVVLAFFISVTLLPVFMSFLTVKKIDKEKNKTAVIMEKMLERIGRWLPFHKGLILIVVGFSVLFAIMGVFKIEARQDIIDTLKENGELDAARKFIDVDMAGSCEFNVSVKGESENAILDPENLNLMARIQARLVEEVPEALKCVSVVDFVKEMNKAMNENDPDYYKIPEKREDILDFFELYDFTDDNANLGLLINSDFSQARIRMFTASADDSVIARKAFDASEKIIREESAGAGVTVGFTGRPKIFLNMVDSLVTGMISSFSFAFVVILVMMIVVFRSPFVGLISMVVNIIPAIFTFGIMGWFNIPLNMITAMVPSIAIGIAVDDTIHFIWRFKKEIQRDGDDHAAIVRTLKTVGKPILITSLLICAGFSVFFFSKLTLLTELGILTIITVLGALLSDLFVAPALFLLLRPLKKDADNYFSQKEPFVPSPSFSDRTSILDSQE